MRRQAFGEVDIVIDAASETPLYVQIYDELRLKISSGALKAGERLPSIRALSGALGVSQITVEKAYTQLVVEGYVQAEPRSGHVVQRLNVEYLGRPQKQAHDIERIVEEHRARTSFLGHQNPQAPRYDFAYFDLPAGAFPAKDWQRLSAEVLRRQGEGLFSRYDNMMFSGSLQRALVGYLARARSVECLPEQVLVCPGTIPALFSVLSLFDPERDVVAQEDPGYSGMGHVASRMGFATCSLPIADDPGEYFAVLHARRPRIVFATPSNQFPTGRVMTLAERIRLLEYAAACDAYIIEDDSCSEYRYKTRPVPALKSLDADGRVIYVNSFSKTLSPALRVAYAVLPSRLLARHLDSFFSQFSYVDALTQETLALFVERGLFDQHLKRMRADMHVRRDVLCDRLTGEFGGDVDVSGIDSGLHLFVTVHAGMAREQLVAAALAHGAGVYADYSMAPGGAGARAADGSVIVGFSRIDSGDIEPGVAALRAAWFSSGGRS